MESLMMGNENYVTPGQHLSNKLRHLEKTLEAYLKLRGGNHVSKEGKEMALAFADYKSYKESLNGQCW
jgi:hypothetical protein